MKPNADEIPAKDRRLCARCVREQYLRDIIETSGDEVECSYCDWTGSGRSFSIADVADLVGRAFGEHYMQIFSDDQGIRNGDEVEIVIADAANISDEPAEDIRQVLDDRTSSPPDEQYQEDPFAKGTRYVRARTNDDHYQEEWRNFENALKTEARFFSRAGYATLKNVFAGLGTHRTDKGDAVIVEAGKDKSLKSLYRARVFQSESKLKEALMRPDQQIGPPGSEFATAGRMNARGISVFYGAIELKTALAELRPPVGSDVVIGRFDIIKDVQLLNVDALAAIEVGGSIFDQSYIQKLARAKFLSSLSHRITRPIMPDDELSEYLVTQAIADFLATELKLDGIIYRSAQAKGGTNVALFHHASKVAPYEIPEGTESQVYTGKLYEDEAGREFHVFEEVPLEQPPKSKLSRLLDLGWGVRQELSPEPFLKLDIQSVCIHEIQAVEYSSEEHAVSRSRVKKSAEPNF